MRPYILILSLIFSTFIQGTSASSLDESLLSLKTQAKKRKAFEKRMKTNGTRYNGYRPKAQENKILRPSRTFKGERTPQILRWISSQLFIALENEKKKVVEIEFMYLGGNLYGTANTKAASLNLYNLLSKDGLKKSLLVSSKKSSKTYSYKRSERQRKKLLTRVFSNPKMISSTSSSDQERARKLARTIKENKEVYSLSLKDEASIKATFNESGKIYILTEREKDNGRHAEEWLMDVFELQTSKKVAFVRGKKRPCLTCSGRMHFINKQFGNKVNYNSSSGYAYKGRFIKQPPNVALCTQHLMEVQKCHETVGGGTGYDSDSESDLETEE